MKRIIISLCFILAASLSAFSMNYEEARERALYLTDKMAYELNLNDQQYDDAYEINLDYLMSLTTADDIAGMYLDYRANDFRSILYDWQWNLFIGADYFLRPVMWRAGAWYYPIYGLYHHNCFFYGHPHGYWDYRGAHCRAHFRDVSFYSNRRPMWDGGMRGRDMVGVSRDMRQRDMQSHMSTRGDRGMTRSSGGREMHFDSRSGRMGNSFNNSSTRSSSTRSQSYDSYERSTRSDRSSSTRGSGNSYSTPNTRSSRSANPSGYSSSRGNNSSNYGSTRSYSTPNVNGMGSSRSSRGSSSSSMSNTRSSTSSGFSGHSSNSGSRSGGSFSGGSHGGGSHGGGSHGGGRGGR